MRFPLQYKKNKRMESLLIIFCLIMLSLVLGIVAEYLKSIYSSLIPKVIFIVLLAGINYVIKCKYLI